ncbi:transposable element Tcb1 transposase [Trichonephila clavipes]|nr:transposable element Tcb1 transposase [Trichonephila clavipes]
MSRRKQRSAFDQVSEFDRGRIVAYRDCGLSFREIGSRVGRNQTTVMRICDRWMQEGTMDRRGRFHPPHYPTSREDRTKDVSTANGAMKEGCERQNGMKLSLLTSHASVCKTTMVGFESGYTVERGCLTAALCTARLVLHRVLWYGGGIGYRSHTFLVRIAVTLNSQRYISEVLEPAAISYLQGLGKAIFQQDNA